MMAHFNMITRTRIIMNKNVSKNYVSVFLVKIHFQIHIELNKSLILLLRI